MNFCSYLKRRTLLDTFDVEVKKCRSAFWQRFKIQTRFAQKPMLVKSSGPVLEQVKFVSAYLGPYSPNLIDPGLNRESSNPRINANTGSKCFGILHLRIT
ncbi:hypothetical protein AVEN_51452-1 [Araneus ventricosus]|uniref:Uncharacterized protein n=1 Tax=Araneus ventricosus TaxID=182803 RepID=A0A4Y2KFI7_ARAVE|nr:hypothetical protein AVEN_51452-1 [Araneus ventricosus]